MFPFSEKKKRKEKEKEPGRNYRDIELFLVCTLGKALSGTEWVVIKLTVSDPERPPDVVGDHDYWIKMLWNILLEM